MAQRTRTWALNEVAKLVKHEKETDAEGIAFSTSQSTRGRRASGTPSCRCDHSGCGRFCTAADGPPPALA